MGLKTAPVVRRFFDTEDTALEYAVHIQRDRRNLTDGEILGCIELLGARKKRGRPEKLAQSCANFQKGKSAAELASTLGISTLKLEMARTVADHGDAKMKEDIILKKTSINKAYQEIQARRKEEKDMPQTQEDFISPPSAVHEHVSLRMAPVEKVEDIVNQLEEVYDDLETFNAAHDSACNEMRVLTEASMVAKCWAIKIIDGFDPHCVDYIIVGQGEPPAALRENQEIFVAPWTAPAQTEASDTEDASNEEISTPTSAIEPNPVNPKNLNSDGWYDLEQAWGRDSPVLVADPAENNAVESVIEGAGFEQSASEEPDMTQVPTDKDTITLIEDVKTEPTLDPKIAQILDLKAEDRSNVIVKFLIRQGVCRIGSLGKILIDRDRLLSFLLERDANTLDGFTGLLTEFKAAPYIALPPDDDLQLELHHNFFDYPYGAKWFWEQCSMKDDEGFLLSEGGFGANLLAFMAQHGLESLHDVVGKVAQIHEELRPRNSVSAGPDPQPFFSASLNQFFAKRVDTPNMAALSAG